MKILIKFPTRNRKNKFFNTLKKYHNLCEDINNVKFLISIDEDDSEMNNPDTLEILKTDKREIIFDSIQNKFNIQRFLDMYSIQKINYLKQYNKTKKVKTTTRKTKKNKLASKPVIPLTFYTNSSSSEEQVPTKKYAPIILEPYDSSSD